MNNKVVQNCACRRTNKSWCSLSPDCIGWGCRLLTIVPDHIPANEYERGKLFSKVYSEAETIGVLECPFYKSTIIDDVVENPTELQKIVELLSDKLAPLG